MVTIDQLPDDILLLVFRMVGAAQLLREVRAVCRRWRQLALHADAWKHRSISTCYTCQDEKMLVYQVLKLAPCLKTLKTRVEDLEGNTHLEELVCTTACAVKNLELNVSVDKLYEASEILKNQMAKEKLRSLSLRLPSDKNCVRFIIDNIKDYSLNFLKIVNSSNDGSPLCMPTKGNVWGKGSLKKLRYEGRATDTLLAFLLRVRCLSLQIVNIILTAVENFSVPSFAQLENCVHLTQITMNPVVKELDVLKHCTRLTYLILSFEKCDNGSFDDPDLTAALNTYFRSSAAAKLNCLGLASGHVCSDVLALECLSALAVSRVSVLKRLGLLLQSFEDLDSQLGQVLPVLPQLQQLLITGMKPSTFPHLLDAICTGNAPSLTELRMLVCAGSFSLGREDLLGIRRLVQRDSKLQVEMVEYCCPDYCGHDEVSDLAHPTEVITFGGSNNRSQRSIIIKLN